MRTLRQGYATPDRVVESGFDPHRLAHYEGLFTLGSGTLHLRGAVSEPLDAAPPETPYLRLPTNVTAERHRDRVSRPGTYLPAVVGRHPLLNTVVVNLPWPLLTVVSVAGRRLSVESPLLVEHTRTLVFEGASLERESRWQSTDGAFAAVLREHRFVSRVRPSLIVQEFNVERPAGGAVDVEAGIDGRVLTNGYDHFTSVEAGFDRESVLRVAVETDLGRRALVLSTVVGPIISPASSDIRGRLVVQRCAQMASGNSPVSFAKYSFVTELTEEVDETAVRREFAEAVSGGSPALWNEHADEWRRLWATADVSVEPADASATADRTAAELPSALRFSMFHLLRAHREGESRFTICPKGHAGEAYFGRYFWDTEIYLLPFFIYSHPLHARDILRFRIRTLDGARRNASAYRAEGARFAWESSLDGTEQCPNWQYADHEIHVTADIVYAIAHYVAATGDEAFLLDEATPLIVEAARFYRSRIDWTEDGSPHLLGVMGPDEYAPFSNDNAFTNYLVAFCLRYAADLIDRLASMNPSLPASLALDDLPLLDEAAGFRLIADGLPIPEDRERGLVLQSADSESLPVLDRSGLSPELPVAAQLPQELLYRRRAPKQADVVALFALFPGCFPHDVMQTTFDYYESLTTHDSSLSPTTHALVDAQLGRPDAALRFLGRSLAIDIDPAGGDASQGVHIANAGGNWQVVVFGFLGLTPAVVSPRLTLNPHLPSAIRRISTRLVWRSSCVRVAVDHNEVSIEHLEGPPLEVVVHGESIRLDPAGSVARRHPARPGVDSLSR